MTDSHIHALPWFYPCARIVHVEYVIGDLKIGNTCVRYEYKLNLLPIVIEDNNNFYGKTYYCHS